MSKVERDRHQRAQVTLRVEMVKQIAETIATIDRVLAAAKAARSSR